MGPGRTRAPIRDQTLPIRTRQEKRTSVVGPVLAVVGCPEHINCATRVGGSDKRGGFRVGSTGHGLVVSTLDGAGVGDLTDGRAWERLSSSDRTLEGLAIDGDRGDNTVGLGEREKHE